MKSPNEKDFGKYLKNQGKYLRVSKKGKIFRLENYCMHGKKNFSLKAQK